MSKKSKFAGIQIGDRVKSDRWFFRRCKGRFAKVMQDGYHSDAQPVVSPIEGHVVGLRNVIMSNFHYDPPGNTWNSTTQEVDEREGETWGNKEVVLLVAKSPWQEPVIVRISDAQPC